MPPRSRDDPSVFGPTYADGSLQTTVARVLTNTLMFGAPLMSTVLLDRYLETVVGPAPLKRALAVGGWVLGVCVGIECAYRRIRW